MTGRVAPESESGGHSHSPADMETPAFVFDASTLVRSLAQLQRLQDASGAKLLFSIKACALRSVLEIIAKHVDGFSVSSWFESRLARTVLADKGTVHLTSPGLNARELAAAADSCDKVSFNSLTQWHRLRAGLHPGVQAGLRVNPQRAYVADERYNPCRPYSKLGVPLADLQSALADGSLPPASLQGLHFHSHCESDSYRPLTETLNVLERAVPALFERIGWLNLGGGYYAHANDSEALAEQVAALRRRYGFEVYMEPGKAVVGEAGSLAASVVDIFSSDGKTLAVLDTSVNHQPEVFEYGRVPPVREHDAAGSHRYLLVGGTCLAGDLFGEYAFTRPLEIGSRITFQGVGAYSLAKAHRFNGHSLPNVYLRDSDGRLHLVVQDDYEDYARLWGRAEAVSTGNP